MLKKSKMVLDATRKQRPQPAEPRATRLPSVETVRALREVDRRILDLRFVHETMLLVKVRGEGKPVIEQLVRHPALTGVAVIAAVSEDVDLDDKENYIWGVFTRFDCERDILFTHQELIGISPVYKGVMGIDATWKTGYPAALTMPEAVVKAVDGKWGRIIKN